ncbi:MAG: YbhB/YbcL family Raf kinase inhibitor-like protein [Planctomycetes bacterium]|nr:YbhB/YbcL family Raf kinase inhibitor-like protein [Planctomycetota bacterium]
MTLTTPAFKSGDPIPKKHASAGENASPALNWLKPPAGTKEFALIMEDSTNSHVHWVIYKIPAATTGLKEAMPGPAKLTEPAGAIQGKGYSGPGPGPGPAHKYVFTLYALDAALDLKPGLNKKPLEEAMKGHILATAQLIGTYQRPS